MEPWIINGDSSAVIVRRYRHREPIASWLRIFVLKNGHLERDGIIRTSQVNT